MIQLLTDSLLSSGVENMSLQSQHFLTIKAISHEICKCFVVFPSTPERNAIKKQYKSFYDKNIMVLILHFPPPMHLMYSELTIINLMVDDL